MRLRCVLLSSLCCLSATPCACLPDNPSVDTGGTETGETGATGETGDERVEAGLLGCPSGESCTIVAVSQTIDDRVELYTGRGAGDVYRGAIDLDMKVNPGGDISGEKLDEPYGLAWDGSALHVLVGHYPSRGVGSLLSFPAGGLTGVEAGAYVALGEWFDGVQASGLGARLRPLDRTEPLSMIVDAQTKQLLIAVFANDLMIPDTMWTEPSELLVLAEGEDTPRTVDPGCAGAWSIAALDDEGEALALACDGDERVAILDSAALVQGGDPSMRCVGEVPFAGKSVRYLAADGLGGVVLTEHPIIVSATESARLWWFDGDCSLRGFSELEGSSSWSLRELAPLPSVSDPRWLLARADGDARGVLIMAGDPGAGAISECGRLDGLDDAGAWTASGGTEGLRPHALALTRDGRGLAVGAGPADYPNAGPGYGSVWWTELDYGDEPGDAVAVAPVELSASAPAVDAQVAQTWRRAPDVVHLIEVEE